MRAASEGASEVGGHIVIGILADAQSRPTSALDIAITTGIGQARNNINVLSSDILVACGSGGAGTVSEIALALKAGKQLILLTPDPLSDSFFTALGRELVVSVSTVEEAIVMIRKTAALPERIEPQKGPGGVIIRAAETVDDEEWLRLRSALWPDSSRADHLADMDEIRVPASRQFAFVAARESGGLGGFVEVSIRPYADGCSTKPVGYLEGWYVDPDLRRKGVGAALVHAAEAWAAASGCVEMGSDCLLDNETGLSSHLGIGYEEVERAIHLKRWIGPSSER
jgi:aminoglycoside 6'-N-acetyltransferase I